MGVMRGPAAVKLFVKKRLWEAGSVLGVILAMTAARPVVKWNFGVEVPPLAISGVAIEEDWSDSFGL